MREKVGRCTCLIQFTNTGAGAIIRKSILPFKIPEHQKTFLFGELCFVWAFSLNQLGEITLVKVRDRTTFLSP